mmetsp:Transcript_40791/g.66152  ORF Transcript_40791/g.66152 Transcript_40791/m.66152 type:complete len:257 (-) Transcript_40791:6-776(-)
MTGVRPLFRVLRLQQFPVFHQLQIEEALLRADSGNWCVITDGAAPASIVMGIGGKPERLLNLSCVKERGTPVIRRFSGGGTVVLDENSLLVSLICNQPDIGVVAFPRNIMQWTESFYASVFQQHALVSGRFLLRENDYCIDDRKIGGNAQCIIKDRWLHHTSFLWDFDPTSMELLSLPEKRPNYRMDRLHGDFLDRMNRFLPNKSSFLSGVLRELANRFHVKLATLEDLEDILRRPHHSGSRFVDVGSIYQSSLQK